MRHLSLWDWASNDWCAPLQAHITEFIGGTEEVLGEARCTFRMASLNLVCLFRAFIATLIPKGRCRNFVATSAQEFNWGRLFSPHMSLAVGLKVLPVSFVHAISL
jgi:hypothetical protein